MIKQKRLLQILFLILFLAIAIRIQPNINTKANPDSQSIPILSMPKEYINYTITSTNGQFWVKVCGKYPVNILNPSCSQLQFPMVYPTPPNTTNIHIKLDDKEVFWTNYSQIYPQALHHTAIGDWSMIQCSLENVSDSFLLEIQYEHLVQQINGEYVFLYDLNISPYLSSQSPTSTAYFAINFETTVKNIQIYTTKTDTQWNPVNYTTQKINSITTITTQIDSKYSEFLLGDLAITFDALKTQNNPNFFLIVIISSIGIVVIIGKGILVIYKRRRNR